MTNDEFRVMCQRHDLTYSYSDDGACWRAGNQSLARIELAMKLIDRNEAVKIWNEVVDTKLVESARSQFYWK